MSFLDDKKPCWKCGYLFDPDQLKDRLCRDCELDEDMLDEIAEDEGKGPFDDPALDY